MRGRRRSGDESVDRLLQRAGLRGRPGCLSLGLFQAGTELLQLLAAEPLPYLREEVLLFFFDVVGNVFDGENQDFNGCSSVG